MYKRQQYTSFSEVSGCCPSKDIIEATTDFFVSRSERATLLSRRVEALAEFFDILSGAEAAATIVQLVAAGSAVVFACTGNGVLALGGLKASEALEGIKLGLKIGKAFTIGALLGEGVSTANTAVSFVHDSYQSAIDSLCEGRPFPDVKLELSDLKAPLVMNFGETKAATVKVKNVSDVHIKAEVHAVILIPLIPWFKLDFSLGDTVELAPDEERELEFPVFLPDYLALLNVFQATNPAVWPVLELIDFLKVTCYAHYGHYWLYEKRVELEKSNLVKVLSPVTTVMKGAILASSELWETLKPHESEYGASRFSPFQNLPQETIGLQIILTVSNEADSVVQDVSVFDQIPAYLAPFEVRFIDPPSEVNATRDQFQWDLTLQPGERKHLRYVITTSALGPGQQFVLPGATIEFQNPETGGKVIQKSAMVADVVTGVPSVAIGNLSCIPSIPIAQQRFTLKATISNTGDEIIRDMAVVLRAPTSISTSNGMLKTIDELAPGDTAAVEWTLTASRGGHYELSVEAAATGGDRDIEILSIHVNAPPEVRIDCPTSGITVARDCQIRWTAHDADDPSDSLRIALYYSKEGEQTWVELARDEANDGTYHWCLTGLRGGVYRVKVVAVDPHGASGEAVSGPFTVGALTDSIIAAPNPVTDEGTAFFYTLPEGTRAAQLCIYTVTGEMVVELQLDVEASRFPTSGKWDPVDSAGVPLANGPYIYVLVADGKVIGQGKMVIQR